MCVLFPNRLNSSDTDGEPMYIQMVTALVLQLIQCVVHLPSGEKDNSEEESNKKVKWALEVRKVCSLGCCRI